MLQVKMPKAYEIEYLDVPVPAVGEADVLIKMSTLGICGSDVQVYHGLHNYMTFPVVQGHEGSGVVEKIGDKVTTFKPGDKVTIQPQIFCGKCVPCRIGTKRMFEILTRITDGEGQAEDIERLEELGRSDGSQPMGGRIQKG